ncbi:MAG: GNAT family N-acetyltransferase [Nitrospirae bacterium]|nr:GNAT family N-acetyltransferase [Nitrospirota bacterium]
MHEITYREASPADYPAISELMRQMGWVNCIAVPERFYRMIDNSSRTVVALDESGIIGFARAICDSESNGYITDVAVSPSKQGRGVGRRLVTILMGDNPEIKWVITTAPASRMFWEKLGFTTLHNAMEKKRASQRPSKMHPYSQPDTNLFNKYVLGVVKKIYRFIKP